MRYTETRHLNLPDDTDLVDIIKIDENFEIIDAFLKEFYDILSMLAVGEVACDLATSRDELLETADGTQIALVRKLALPTSE